MDCTTHIHLAAIHAVAGYRGDTLGIGALCRAGDSFVGVGMFSNSLGRTSNYGVYGLQPWTVSGVRLGAFAGMVSGYPRNNGGFAPFAAGVASVPIPIWRRTELHITLIPNTPQSPATAGFSVSSGF